MKRKKKKKKKFPVLLCSKNSIFNFLQFSSIFLNLFNPFSIGQKPSFSSFFPHQNHLTNLFLSFFLSFVFLQQSYVIYFPLSTPPSSATPRQSTLHPARFLAAFLFFFFLFFYRLLPHSPLWKQRASRLLFMSCHIAAVLRSVSIPATCKGNLFM